MTCDSSEARAAVIVLPLPIHAGRVESSGVKWSLIVFMLMLVGSSVVGGDGE